MTPKIVLAFSGGLDTSFCVPYLQERGWEVHTVFADTGGVDAEERAFIEMADRRVEWYFMLPIGNCIRHTHPGLAPLEQPQFPDFGRSQGEKLRETAAWLDGELLSAVLLNEPCGVITVVERDRQIRVHIDGATID